MAKQMGPRFKVARRLGVNVFNHPKALKRGLKKPQGKLSEYGEQLLEKQKLRAYYGVLEKQFRRYVFDSLNAKENSDQFLVSNLERRLDNIVYRLGFGSTLRQSRQMVVHGHILVNGKRVNIPSYKINVGDLISLREKSRKNEKFLENFNTSGVSLNYIEKDLDNCCGRLVKIPLKDEIPIEVKLPKVLEFYSKH